MNNFVNILAVCIFNKKLYTAWQLDTEIFQETIPLDERKLEAALFEILEKIHAPWQRIIIPAGPAPFTQLRILRSVQCGLAAGCKAQCVMVNMFDVLFDAAHLATGICFLDTRRGDYFFQKLQDGIVVESGVKSFENTHTPIISDHKDIATINITDHLAHNMLIKNFQPIDHLIYGIDVKF